MTGHDVFAFGFSRGGTEPLLEILSAVRTEHPVTVFIVQHRPRTRARYLERILGRTTPLPVCLVQTNQPVQPGCVYLAPPDRHLLVWRGRLWLSRGPRENRSRPAIDPLFRSVAVGYGPRAVGVLLSGLLNDGTLGLQAIRTCGGVAVIQDPEDAAYPDMVLSAASAGVDHSLPASRIAPLLNRLATEPPGPAPRVPRQIVDEVRIASQRLDDVEEMEIEDLPSTPVPLSCPECGGPLGEIDDPAVVRYRCRIGHAFTAETLADGQMEGNENALGAAMRSLEEHAHVLARLAEIQREKDRAASAAELEERAEEARRHADQIRRILQRMGTEAV